MSPWLKHFLTTVIGQAYAATLSEAVGAAILNGGQPENADDEAVLDIVADRLQEFRRREAELLAAESRAPLANDRDDLPF